MTEIKFGTDGIRGKASNFNLDGLRSMGNKFASEFNSGILIAYDTRQSSPEFYKTLSEGTISSDTNVTNLSILPTPGLAFASKKLNLPGIMITASHNQYEDNGIKFFKRNGHKIDPKMEKLLQKAYDNPSIANKNINPKSLDSGTENHEIIEQYISHLRKPMASKNLNGFKVVIDCANGATSHIAEDVFSGINGLESIFVNNQPNGRNINERCGATHPENLSEIIKKENANLGICFDGDGDRVIFIDESGNPIDGDHTIGYIAKKMQETNQLKGNVIVTNQSNLALDAHLKNLEIDTTRVDIGDKYVMAQMKRTNASFGGENSGHIIFGTEYGSGDGMYTAAKLLSLIDTNKPISYQLRAFDLNPVYTNKVQVSRKASINEIPGISEITDKFNDKVNGKGRVFLRLSGTEPVIRVLVESPNNEYNIKVGEDISKLISAYCN